MYSLDKKLLDEIAMRVLQGQYARSASILPHDGATRKKWAENAYDMAEAMLGVRSERYNTELQK